MADKYYGTGRRKKSIARVYLIPGTGKITINKRDIDEYLGLETLKVIVRQPLVATETTDKYDVQVNVRGGGFSGQAGAIRHGISRALLQVDGDFRPTHKIDTFFLFPDIFQICNYPLACFFLHFYTPCILHPDIPRIFACLDKIPYIKTKIIAGLTPCNYITIKYLHYAVSFTSGFA